jgi:hypothetical protein
MENVLIGAILKKVKAMPVTGLAGQKDCETSRLPHFLENQLIDGGEVLSLPRRLAALYSLGSFLVLISVRG